MDGCIPIIVTLFRVFAIIYQRSATSSMWRARCTAAATPSTRTCRGRRRPSGAPRCPGPSWGCRSCSTWSRASTWGTASLRVPGPGSVDRYLRYYVSNVSLGWHFTMRQFSLLWMSLVTMFSPKLPPTLLCTRWVVGRNIILIYALSTLSDTGQIRPTRVPIRHRVLS